MARRDLGLAIARSTEGRADVDVADALTTSRRPNDERGGGVGPLLRTVRVVPWLAFGRVAAESNPVSVVRKDW